MPPAPQQDLLLPEEVHGFVTLRCPLADLEEEELGPFLPGGWAWHGIRVGLVLAEHSRAAGWSFAARQRSLPLRWRPAVCRILPVPQPQPDRSLTAA